MIIVKQIEETTLNAARLIWNEVVEEGRAFPQLETLTLDEAREFFNSQSFTGVAVDEDNSEVVGLYTLHPNNVGRCGHISNASYAVKSNQRGRHIGEILVTDCLNKARELGFKILQFNAVVESNAPALRLYQKLGFTQLGTIPKGFLNKDGVYENIIVHYYDLTLS